MPGQKPVHRHQPRTENRFREREVARVMRAAKASKLPVKEITVDPKTGKIGIVVGTAGEEGNPPPGAAAWDEATEKLEAKNKQR
jgi:hypothetical protein